MAVATLLAACGPGPPGAPTDAAPPTAEVEGTVEAAPPAVADDTGGPTVVLGDAKLSVEIADTASERAQGLSGRDSLPPDSGMLFIFEGGRAGQFWMKDMHFALDFVWIGSDCTVVDVTPDVPPPEPGTPDGGLLRYESSVPAAYVLELNAGRVAQSGIAPGDGVRFLGVDTPGPGC